MLYRPTKKYKTIEYSQTGRVPSTAAVLPHWMATAALCIKKWKERGLKCIILVVTQLSFNHVVNAPVGLTTNCTLGDVHLLNGTSEHEGRVEVCFGNVWSTVCSKSWDNRDAGVICKQLFNSSFGRQCI